MPNIPSSTPSRLASNIPLQTIHGIRNSSAADRGEQSESLLPAEHQPTARGVYNPSQTVRHRRNASTGSEPASYAGSESSWTDTGDIAEQLTAEDPLRDRLLDEPAHADFLAGIVKRQSQHKKHKRVRYQESTTSSRNRSTSPYQHHRAGLVNKEAIHIPDAVVPQQSRAERLIARIMSGGSSPIHGLTGKPLIYFTSVFVSLGVFLFGYDQGVMSGIITGPYFKEYFNNPTRAQVGAMVAILEVGAFISSLMVGRIGDIIGRRRTILYGSMIFFVGGAMQTLATGFEMMLVGRVIAGLGVGMLSTIVPVYQSEISPPHNRGKLACIEFTGNIFGYATSVWVDYFCGFITSNMSWRLPLMMQCIMGALLGLGSLIIVESPRWLLDNDHDEEGIVVIANLYGGGDIHNSKAREEFRDIKMDVLIQRQEGERSYSEMFRRYRTRVFIAMSAQALAQLNGINVISYYAPYVFESAGWVGHDAVLMTGINGITYLLSTVPPWYIVDSWGRRPILLSGAAMMTGSLAMISYFLYLDIKQTPMLVVIFVMIYNAAFGYSWGPIPWLYPPEILPLSIRSKGASLSTATNWAFNWLVGMMTPILQDIIHWRLYLVHAFFCASSFVIVYFIYPETCGVRLEDMGSLFGDSTTAMGTPATMGTPAQDPETGALLRPSSPIPPLDIRNGSGGPFGAAGAIPGLNIDPPDQAAVDAKNSRDAEQGGGGIGAWFSRLMGRGRSRNGESSRDGGRYTAIGQGDD